MKYGVKIETFKAAGRYQHKVTDIGVGPDRKGELSERVVEALKKVNEMVWEEMPVKGKNLVIRVEYTAPKEKEGNLALNFNKKEYETYMKAMTSEPDIDSPNLNALVDG